MKKEIFEDEVRESLENMVEYRRKSAEKTAGFLKKHTKKGVAVGVLMLSLLASMAFSGASEITADQMGDNYNQPPIVMDIGDYGNATVDDDDDDATEQKSGKIGLIAKFKQAVLTMPKSVRIILIVPLWAAGTAIMTLLSVFWKFLFATPVGGMILATVAGWGVLVGLLAVTAKILFPEIPLRQILTKNNLIILAVVALLLAGADAVAPLFWNKYPLVSAGVKFSAGAIIVSVLTARVRSIFNRDKYKNMPQPA
ncbi:MAG: hypothetical protein MJ127_04160 [Mogibacterium sp.]|nr:hypothetical protein [Mogibacterium sp.]